MKGQTEMTKQDLDEFLQDEDTQEILREYVIDCLQGIFCAEKEFSVTDPETKKKRTCHYHVSVGELLENIDNSLRIIADAILSR